MAHTPEMNPVIRYFESDKVGWKGAIAAMCATCVGCTSTKQGKGFEDYMTKGFRSEIRNCQVFSCPLRTIRPYKEIKDGKKRPLQSKPK